MGEPVRGLAQPAVAHLLRAAVRPDRDQREPAGIALSPAVADLDADVELRGDRPAELADQGLVAAAVRQHAAEKLISRRPQVQPQSPYETPLATAANAPSRRIRRPRLHSRG